MERVSENKRCCCWRTLSWDHLHAVTPLNPAIRPQSFPIPQTSIHCTHCVKTLRGIISLNKHQNLLLLWLISFWIPAELWEKRHVAKWAQQPFALQSSLIYVHHMWKAIHRAIHQLFRKVMRFITRPIDRRRFLCCISLSINFSSWKKNNRESTERQQFSVQGLAAEISTRMGGESHQTCRAKFAKAPNLILRTQNTA